MIFLSHCFIYFEAFGRQLLEKFNQEIEIWTILLDFVSKKIDRWNVHKQEWGCQGPILNIVSILLLLWLVRVF